MTFRSRTHGRFVRVTGLGTRLGTVSHNISFRRTVPGRVLGAEAGSPATLHLSDPRVAHYFIHGFGMRRKEPAPRLVVAPSRHRLPLLRSEPQPPLHVSFRYPEAFHAPALAEHTDIWNEGDSTTWNGVGE